MKDETLKIPGGCHCGGIRYHLAWPSSTERVPARACSCSYCTRFAARWTSNPDATLSVVFRKRNQAARYRFGSNTADFIFCRDCGVLCVAISHIDGHDYAVVNVNTFTTPGAITFANSESDFSAENTPDRMARRKQRWIKTVDCQFHD